MKEEEETVLLAAQKKLLAKELACKRATGTWMRSSFHSEIELFDRIHVPVALFCAPPPHTAVFLPTRQVQMIQPGAECHHHCLRSATWLLAVSCSCVTTIVICVTLIVICLTPALPPS